MLRKCEIARLFDIPEVVMAALEFGGMTRMICEDIQRGRYLWTETRAGISLKRAKQRWVEKVRKLSLSHPLSKSP